MIQAVELPTVVVALKRILAGYISQGLGPGDCAQRRADRLYSRAGSEVRRPA